MDFQTWKTSYEATPGVLGVSDCCLAVADWAIANGYQDGAADLRGQYATEEEMYATIAEHGDITATVAHCARIAGITETTDRGLGTIAVVGKPEDMYRQWAAIWDGVRWQVRLKDGFRSLDAYCIRMWKV